MLELLILIAALWCFLIWPKTAPESVIRSLKGRYYAHRGLHEKDKSVPENSLTAFDRACRAGYGIELDVRPTADRQIVVFHDGVLMRMCGDERKVEDCTLSQLQDCRLAGTDQRIPTFAETLALVNGRAPLIVELKACRDWELLCEQTWAQLKAYKGPYCIESFDPRIVHWFKSHAPAVIRGLLAEPCGDYRDRPWYQGLWMGALLANGLCRPHFIAYKDVPEHNLSVKLTRLIGGMWVVWTVRDEKRAKELEQTRHAIIFEFFTPETHFTAPKN